MHIGIGDRAGCAIVPVIDGSLSISREQLTMGGVNPHA